jgi:hypothetical protein
MNRLLAAKKNILKPPRYLSPELEAEAAIRKYDQKNFTVGKEIQHNILAQNIGLAQRMFLRRENGRVRIYSSDPNNKSFRIFQDKIEEAIETLLLAKIASIKQVRKKYKPIIHNGNALAAIENMNKEVEEIEIQFDKRKKEVIGNLFRNNY